MKDFQGKVQRGRADSLPPFRGRGKVAGTPCSGAEAPRRAWKPSLCFFFFET